MTLPPTLRASIVQISFFVMAWLLSHLLVGPLALAYVLLFVGGFILWWTFLRNTSIDPHTIIVPYLLTVIMFIVHVRSYTRAGFPDIVQGALFPISFRMMLTFAAPFAPVIWLLGALPMLKKYVGVLHCGHISVRHDVYRADAFLSLRFGQWGPSTTSEDCGPRLYPQRWVVTFLALRSEISRSANWEMRLIRSSHRQLLERVQHCAQPPVPRPRDGVSQGLTILRCVESDRKLRAAGILTRFSGLLPYRGLFVWHVGHDDVLGDAEQVLFLYQSRVVPYEPTCPEATVGDTDKLGAVAYYHYKDVHRYTFRITELVPGRRVAFAHSPQ